MYPRIRGVTSLTRHFNIRLLHTERQNPASASHKTAQASANRNAVSPSFSFKDLGAIRAVKITVIAALSIVGTLETIFYTKALWRYFVPGESSTPSKSSEHSS